MDIKELKSKIKDKCLTNDMLVFQYTDNKWLVNNYIQGIASVRNQEIVHIDSLNNLNNLYDDNNYLYVYEVDEFEQDDYVKFNNLIVVTKKTNSFNAVVFPKLETWQIQDYLKLRLNGLSKEEFDCISNLIQQDIYLATNESSKLAIFPDATQSNIFDLLQKEGNYDYLKTFNAFELSNTIIKKDPTKLQEILNNGLNIEPMALIGILLPQYRKLIKVKMGNNVTAESLNMNPKAFSALTYYASKYSCNELVNTYEFLTSIDYRVKEGLLDMDKNSLLNYIIVNLF